MTWLHRKDYLKKSRHDLRRAEPQITAWLPGIGNDLLPATNYVSYPSIVSRHPSALAGNSVTGSFGFVETSPSTCSQSRTLKLLEYRRRALLFSSRDPRRDSACSNTSRNSPMLLELLLDKRPILVTSDRFFSYKFQNCLGEYPIVFAFLLINWIFSVLMQVSTLRFKRVFNRFF